MSLNTFTYLRALSGACLCFMLRRRGGVNGGVGWEAGETMRNSTHLHSDHPKYFGWQQQQKNPFHSHVTLETQELPFLFKTSLLFFAERFSIVLSHLLVFPSSPNMSFTLITHFKWERKLCVSNPQSCEEFVQIIKIHETRFVNKTHPVGVYKPEEPLAHESETKQGRESEWLVLCLTVWEHFLKIEWKEWQQISSLKSRLQLML